MTKTTFANFSTKVVVSCFQTCCAISRSHHRRELSLMYHPPSFNFSSSKNASSSSSSSSIYISIQAIHAAFQSRDIVRTNFVQHLAAAGLKQLRFLF
mmetsp:Transcript_6735/g.9327  ORF Transcript_6735/g.9327 Transcript_6735/m.9327 type:complete len:97 (-) Transcript_6735:448-738(-)